MRGQANDRTRVWRGGSFNNNQNNVRCAYRNRNNPDNLNNNMGFRVALSHVFLSYRKYGASRIPIRRRGLKNGLACSWPRSAHDGRAGQIQNSPAPWVRPWGGAPFENVSRPVFLGQSSPRLSRGEQGQTGTLAGGDLRVPP
ncbi:MAG: SUMF1/EgtB/PvdO family nonheme iron enzyme [Anaerolineae bacterium]